MTHTSRDTNGHGLALGYQWVHTSWYLQHQFQWWSAGSAAAPPRGTSLYHAGPQLLYWCSQQRPWRLGIAWTRNLQHTRLTSAPNKTAVSKNATHRHTRVSHCLGMITMIVYHTIWWWCEDLIWQIVISVSSFDTVAVETMPEMSRLAWY